MNCHNVAFRRLIHFQDEHECHNIILLKEYVIFILSNCLRVCYYGQSTSHLLMENILTVCGAQSSTSFFALTSNHSLYKLHYNGILFEAVLIVPLDLTVLVHAGIKSIYHQRSSAVQFSLWFNEYRNILTISTGNALSVGIEVDCICNNNESLAVQPVSVSDTDLSVLGMTVCGSAAVCFGNSTHLNHIPKYYQPALANGRSPTLTMVRIDTKHKGWVTALSSSRAGLPCEWLVSGDCLGKLLVWRCSDDGQQIKLLTSDKAVCEGRSISAILVDSELNVMWVGDCSGAVTCAHISLNAKSLERLKCINLFSEGSGGPSIIEWFPSHTGSGESRSAELTAGLLRCYSPQSRVAAEGLVSTNVASCFKVWPEHGPVQQHRSYVESCAVLHHLNLIATVGFTQSVYLWDMDSGQLVHSLRTDDFFAKCLAVFDQPRNEDADTEVALVASGHSNGKVSVFQMHVANQSEDKGQGGDDDSCHSSQSRLGAGSQSRQSVGANSEHLPMTVAESLSSALPLFDIIEQGTTQLVNRAAAVSVIADSKPNVHNAKSLSGDEDVGPSITHKLVVSRSFSPLPVSDLFFSTQGGYLVVVHIRKFVMVYQISTDKVVKNLKFSEPFLCINPIASTAPEEQHQRRPTMQAGNNAKTRPVADTMILALQTATAVKILDAVQGVVLTEFSLQCSGSAAMCSGLWDQMLDSRKGDHSISGICVTKDLRTFLFGDLSGFVEHVSHVQGAGPQTDRLVPLTQLPNMTLKRGGDAGSTDVSDIDEVVQGVQVFGADFSPLAAVWCLRLVTLLRVSLEDAHKPQVMRSTQIRILDPKVRVVHSQALKVVPGIRAHRALIVLSDGTAYIVHV